MSQPLVSIVMPAYNHERFVGKTMESLIAQTYPNLECFAIDDGSTDGTAEAMRRRENACRGRFASFDLIVKRNEGVSRTFNLGIEQARGEFVFVVSSDDLFDPRIIEKSVARAAAGEDIALVAADAEFIDGDEAPVTLSTFGVPYRRFVPCHTSRIPGFRIDRDFGSYRSFLYGNYLAPGILLRTSVFRRAGGFRDSFALEDHDAWMRLSKIARFAFLDEPLVKYRLHAGGAHLHKALRISGDSLRMIVGEREEAARRGLEEDWLNACFLAFGNLALKAARAPDVVKAFEVENTGKSRADGDWWRQFQSLMAVSVNRRGEPSWGQALSALAEKAIGAAYAAAAGGEVLVEGQRVDGQKSPSQSKIAAGRGAIFAAMRWLYFRFPRTGVSCRVGLGRAAARWGRGGKRGATPTPSRGTAD